MVPHGTSLVGRDRRDRTVGVLAEELALVAGASAQRRDELAAGRWCAHRAMEALGVPAQPVLRSSSGAPVWPAGLRGSISHCASYAVAAVTRSPTVRALGVDVEAVQRLAPEVVDLVLTAGEHDRPAPGPGEVLRFSAKESVYKAWSAAGGGWLDFSDVEVDVRPDETFVATVLGRQRVGGTWATGQDLVLTLASLTD